MTTFRFEEPDPDDRDTGPDYFLRNPARERAEAERNPQADRPADPRYGYYDGSQPKPEAPQKRKGGCLRRLWWVLLIVIGIACGAAYVRYFVPFTTDSALRGRVTGIERRGIFFKVYETQFKEAGDGAVVRVSVPSDSLAAILTRAMEQDAEVCVVTEKYFTPVPWRGESATIVTAVKP